MTYLARLDPNLEKVVEIPPEGRYQEDDPDFDPPYRHWSDAGETVVFGWALKHAYSDMTLPILNTTQVRLPSRE